MITNSSIISFLRQYSIICILAIIGFYFIIKPLFHDTLVTNPTCVIDSGKDVGSVMLIDGDEWFVGEMDIFKSLGSGYIKVNAKH